MCPRFYTNDFDDIFILFVNCAHLTRKEYRARIPILMLIILKTSNIYFLLGGIENILLNLHSSNVISTYSLAFAF